jgi:hypothetical protein
MCNDYEQRVTWADYRTAMQRLELGTPAEQSEADLPQADDIRVNEVGPVMRLAGNGVKLMPMTFGFPPKSSRGGPVFNFKSEGRRFDNSNPLPDPCERLLRVHRQALSEGQAPLRSQRMRLHGDRGALARDRGR